MPEWTPAEERLIKAMIADNRTPYDVAVALGRSKAAVIGWAWRRNLEWGEGIGRERGKTYGPRLKKVQAVAGPTENSKLLPFEKLAAGACRWPLGDPGTADFRFCGAQSMIGSSYCDAHKAMSVEGPDARKARLAQKAGGERGAAKRWNFHGDYEIA